MNKLILITAILLIGCEPPPPANPAYYDGAICKGWTYNPCGLSLWNCSNGFSYTCVVNVKLIPKDYKGDL